METVIYRPHNMVPPRANGSRLRLDKVTLKSGANHYDDKTVAVLMKHSSFDKLLQLKAIDIVVPETGKSEDVAIGFDNVPQSLDSYTVEDAETMVEGTSDLLILERWLRTESARKPPRKTLVAIINRRMENIKDGI